MSQNQLIDSNDYTYNRSSKNGVYIIHGFTIFLNIQFLIFNKANTQIKIKIIAISTFAPEFMRGSKSP